MTIYRSINALAETINGLYKAEVIHRRGPWRSFEAVELATLEWMDWFNSRRLLEPIGDIPPAEAEERHYAMLEQSAWQRDSNKMASAKPGAVHFSQLVMFLGKYWGPIDSSPADFGRVR